MAIVRRCTFPDDPHIITSGNHRMCPLHGFEIEEIEVPDEDDDGDGADAETTSATADDAAESAASPGIVSATTMQVDGPQFSLEFPWGEEAIHDILRIGRDPAFSPLADKLDADRNPTYATISRVHAELRLRDGRLFVVHLQARNPTYVDGCEIESDVETEVFDECTIGFSNRLECIVRMRD